MINYQDIDYKNIIVPTALVAIIAGASAYLEQQSLGWKAALGAGVATFVITLSQELLKKTVSGNLKASKKGKKNKAVKASWRLFPGQRP
jgi:hypothetical protein